MSMTRPADEWEIVQGRIAQARAEGYAAALADVRERVETIPVADGSHWDNLWNDTTGARDVWHECVRGSLPRPDVLAILDALTPKEPGQR